MGYVAYAPGFELTASEKSRSRLPLIITGTQDQSLALAWARGWVPPVLGGGLYLQEVTVREKTINVWDGEAIYGTVEPPDQNQMTWEWDTTAESIHITQAKGTIQNFNPAGVVATNFGGAIGVTDEDVEGCDISATKFEWQENWQLPRSFCSWTYSQTICSLTATTNSVTFRGFAAGAVLFLGAQAKWSSKDYDLIDISFKFRASNWISFNAGSIVGIAKGPFEYVWFDYQLGIDATSKRRCRIPKQATLVRVYDSADFALLGIPTGLPPR